MTVFRAAFNAMLWASLPIVDSVFFTTFTRFGNFSWSINFCFMMLLSINSIKNWRARSWSWPGASLISIENSLSQS